MQKDLQTSRVHPIQLYPSRTRDFRTNGRSSTAEVHSRGIDGVEVLAVLERPPPCMPFAHALNAAKVGRVLRSWIGFALRTRNRSVLRRTSARLCVLAALVKEAA